MKGKEGELKEGRGNSTQHTHPSVRPPRAGWTAEEAAEAVVGEPAAKGLAVGQCNLSGKVGGG